VCTGLVWIVLVITMYVGAAAVAAAATTTTAHSSSSSSSSLWSVLMGSSSSSNNNILSFPPPPKTILLTLEYLPPSQQQTAASATFLSAMATVLLLLPLVVRQRSSSSASIPAASTATHTKNNTNNPANHGDGGGLWTAAVLIQVMVGTTHALLAWMPVPLARDPVTQAPVNLLRWCEWIPLAGFLTLLSEAMVVVENKDVVEEENENEKDNTMTAEERRRRRRRRILLRRPVGWAVLQSVSCAVGGLGWMVCPTVTCWIVGLLLAVVTSIMMILVRCHHYYQQWKQFQLQQQQQQRSSSSSRSPGKPPARSSMSSISSSGRDVELHDRLQFTVSVLVTCSIVWTLLVIIFGINAWMHYHHQYHIHDDDDSCFSYYGANEDVPHPEHPKDRTMFLDNFTARGPTHLPFGWRWWMAAAVWPAVWLGRIIRSPDFAMTAETMCDVLAKTIYMKLILDVHLSLFDSDGRAQRQLRELRQLMSILWHSSSDVIVMSVAMGNTCVVGGVGDQIYSGDQRISMLSQSFFDLIGATSLPESLRESSSVALMLVTKEDGERSHSYQRHHGSAGCTVDRDDNHDAAPEILSAHFIDSSEIPYGGSFHQAILASIPANAPLVRQAAELVQIVQQTSQQQELHEETKSESSSTSASWSTSSSSPSARLAVHPFQRLSGDEVRCEVRVSSQDDDSDAVIAVLRDVTERYKRFEAEQRAHAGARQRQLDAQAVNRFTRHEVKNGLLAGIELCDSLRTVFDTAEQALQQQEGPPQMSLVGKAGSGKVQGVGISTTACLSMPILQKEIPRRIVGRMENILHEVLDTVLAEAMARDVIHEVYQPRLERVDVKSILTSTNAGIGTMQRFPLQIKGGNLPVLLLDPQLLRYIHRNAFSNACKYGRPDGRVWTDVAYNYAKRWFEMRVNNEPGQGHDELVKLGPAASGAVFSQGTRMQVNATAEHISSGDGAWIMQKCAKTLGGSCDISFEQTHTVFSFVCPAEPFSAQGLTKSDDFEVPRGTWGIAVDDSLIQRRLMTRILAHSGVEESRRILIGQDPSGALQLGNILKNILIKDRCCKVLVLVDENLDYSHLDMPNFVLSGSLIMRDVLKNLSSDQESRVFSLVRSANDSSEDLALYSERAHGFFPKAPTQRERVLEILAPLWNDRFRTPS